MLILSAPLFSPRFSACVVVYPAKYTRLAVVNQLYTLQWVKTMSYLSREVVWGCTRTWLFSLCSVKVLCSPQKRGLCMASSHRYLSWSDGADEMGSSCRICSSPWHAGPQQVRLPVRCLLTVQMLTSASAQLTHPSVTK